MSDVLLEANEKAARAGYLPAKLARVRADFDALRKEVEDALRQ
jgi:hypothetical protein